MFDRLAVTAVGVALVAWVSAGWPRGARWAVTALVAMAALAPIALRDGDLDGMGRVGVIVGLGLLAALVAIVAEETTRTRPPLAVVPALLVAGTIVSLAFVQLSSGQQGQSTGFLCAALGGAWFAGMISKRVPGNAVAAALVVLSAILVADWRFNAVSSARPLALALLGLAPLGVLAGEVPGIRSRPLLALVCRVVVVGAIAWAGLMQAGASAHTGAADPAADAFEGVYGG